MVAKVEEAFFEDGCLRQRISKMAAMNADAKINSGIVSIVE